MRSYACVIISYRQPQMLAEVLARLAEQSHRPSLVVVVDNGGDLPAEVIEASGLADLTELVRLPDNPGYGAAVNAARERIHAASIRDVLVLTHDAVFDAELAARLGAALEVPGRGAVGPLLRWGSDPTRVFSAGGRLTRGGRAWNTVVPVSSTEPYEVDWLDGAIVMYDIEALDAIDWLDEGYFLYFEDVDTSWRLQRAGRKVCVVPTAEARQQPGAHPMYLGIRNMTLFAGKAQIPLLPHLGAVVRRTVEEAVYRLLHRRPLDVVAAWHGWRDGRRGYQGHPPRVSAKE